MSGQVTVHGDVDAPSFLSSLDVLIMPVQSTGRMIDPPLTLLEAMAAGTNVVTTGIGAIPELINDGVNGLLVPEASRTDPGAYAELTMQLLQDSDKRMVMRAAARESVAGSDVRRGVADHLRVYSDVVAEARH